MEWKQIIEEKIFTDLDHLTKTVNKWKVFNDKVVFTNGCFDILHLGHLDYLTKSAELGDRLIIAVNSDVSVSTLKGPNRPIIDEQTRALKLASLAYVDAIYIFDDETPINIIKSLMPDVLVKGGDYTVETIVGSSEVLANGGLVEVIPFLEGHSTSTIIDKIKNS